MEKSIDPSTKLIAGYPVTKREQNRRYPINWDGKEYFSRDVHQDFCDAYTEASQLRFDMGIYLNDGVVIYPDGSMQDESGE
jgi:hypothetical protein